MLKSPCTKTCPRRAAGCAINCPDWKSYTAERQKIYECRKQNATIRLSDGFYYATNPEGSTIKCNTLTSAVKHSYDINEEI